MKYLIAKHHVIMPTCVPAEWIKQSFIGMLHREMCFANLGDMQVLYLYRFCRIIGSNRCLIQGDCPLHVSASCTSDTRSGTRALYVLLFFSENPMKLKNLLVRREGVGCAGAPLRPPLPTVTIHPSPPLNRRTSTSETITFLSTTYVVGNHFRHFKS